MLPLGTIGNLEQVIYDVMKSRADIFSAGGLMRRRIFVLALMIVVAMSMPAFASELDELKAVVRQLQQRIEQLENQQKMQAAKPPALNAFFPAAELSSS